MNLPETPNREGMDLERRAQSCLGVVIWSSRPSPPSSKFVGSIDIPFKWRSQIKIYDD